MSVKAKIKKITALEILDSRGIPTLSVRIELQGGVKASAQVPSGTSAGKHEAFELRDEEKSRYGGKGVLKAVRLVNRVIFPKLKGLSVLDQKRIDDTLLQLDGTKNKSRLGANSILGVSKACARAGAYLSGLPLYSYLRKTYRLKHSGFRLPQPMFNLLNGGRHAESGMDVQEFMLVPQTKSFSESLRYASETFFALKKLLQLGKFSTGVGAEGGFAPLLSNSKQAIEVLLEATRQAGLPKGAVRLALDIAASELYSESARRYVFKREKANFTTEQLIGWYIELVRSYPIVSIEDGLHEEDWEGWQKMNQKLGRKIKVVGDDLTVTNPRRLQQAIDQQAINALIIKPNQIGSVSETIETILLAQQNGIAIIVSHRSGGTNDSFIADLAVAVNAEFIKSGSVCRGERLAKYNRLLEIERQLK